MYTDFQELFKGMEPKYVSALLERLGSSAIGGLTQLEKELCILLWMNFDQYEIAQLLNIELADVEMEREQIRLKLALVGEGTIQKYMQENLA